METLTYLLLFAALLMISTGAVCAIIYYDRRKQRQLEQAAKENADGR